MNLLSICLRSYKRKKKEKKKKNLNADQTRKVTEASTRFQSDFTVGVGGVHGGKLTSSFKYLPRTTPTNYITGVFGCRHVTFILEKRDLIETETTDWFILCLLFYHHLINLKQTTTSFYCIPKYNDKFPSKTVIELIEIYTTDLPFSLGLTQPHCSC